MKQLKRTFHHNINLAVYWLYFYCLLIQKHTYL